ncbi:UNVERIFIED_CONTAM: hypothetical protein Slati_0214400 [Sesamum latifolium]|uniref:CCHC-type domain-containing protein n=1 Tax=Sesamum latifolium TaxID=2727402 RepID=A0AAW2YC20_9LAMI
MAEGSSVQGHGVKMLSLVEKLEDLKIGVNNDTYIDVILQSLPPSYDPFIINFNMNGLEKSINELINMLVQYEVTTKKSPPSVLIGEASTSKAKGKRDGRWKRKKGKAKAKVVVATKDAMSAPVAPVGMGKGRRKMGTQQQSRTNDICAHCREKGHWKRDCPKLPPKQGMFVVEVLQRSRKLSKDDVVLRLGDGKAVAAEAVGTVNLVISDRVRLELKDYYFVPSMIKNIISIPLLDNAGKMTRKPFIAQSTLANGLLDLIHTDVYGLLNTQARGGFFYFITFTDDHSRYSYVYQMRYNFEAFVRFKEFRLEVENQTDRKIKTLRSYRRGEYLSGEFLDYKGKWGYALETEARLLNIGPSKSVAQTPYQIWHGKPASYKYLREWGSPTYVKRLVGDKLDRDLVYAVFLERGFPADTRGDELLLEESSEAPQSNAGTSSVPIASTDNVPILGRSARVPQPLERYGFLGVTSQLDTDPKTYGEAMSDIDLEKWLEAMKSEIDSMSSNQV